MNRSIVLPLLLLAACSKSATEATTTSTKAIKVVELGLLMQKEINPPFSRLSFLVYHGDSMEEDAATVKAELEQSATALRASMGRLRVWSRPPTDTTQGREVFYEYATSVDVAAQRLLDAIARDDKPAAAGQLQAIAKTCNNCHHFFRLDLEDSVVGPEVTSRGGRDARAPLGFTH